MYIEKPEKKDEDNKKENKFLKFFINHVVIPYGSRISKTIQYLCEKLEIEDMEQIMLFINKPNEQSQTNKPSKKRKRGKIDQKNNLELLDTRPKLKRRDTDIQSFHDAKLQLKK